MGFDLSQLSRVLHTTPQSGGRRHHDRRVGTHRDAARPEAVVVDSRTSDWFQSGTIPGAVNLPYTYVVDELAQLGCTPDFDGWDCEQAMPVALFCNGVWCGQSPTAIRNMISAGYRADRISYYRGGMQVWRLLGLTVVGGKRP